MISVFIKFLGYLHWVCVIAFLIFVARHEIEKAIFYIARRVVGGEK